VNYKEPPKFSLEGEPYENKPTTRKQLTRAQFNEIS